MGYEEKLKQLADNYGDWWEKGFQTPRMTSELYPYDKMFSPIRVNNLTLKNRLVMAPMGNRHVRRDRAPESEDAQIL